MPHNLKGKIEIARFYLRKKNKRVVEIVVETYSIKR